MGGDFRQVLPVIKSENRVQIFNALMKRHTLWPQFERFELTENLRCRDPEFRDYLLSIGNGHLGATEAASDPGTKVFPVPRDFEIF